MGNPARSAAYNGEAETPRGDGRKDGAFLPGDLVYEIIDAGGLPGRIIATMSRGAEVLIRLDPALSPIPGIRQWNRERWHGRGYLVFRATSLARVSNDQAQAA